VRVAAIVIGLFVAILGLIAVVTPESLLRLVSIIHLPPALYVAAVLRVVFGIIFIQVAPNSRLPIPLRVFGVIMILAGALTPFFGVQILWGTDRRVRLGVRIQRSRYGARHRGGCNSPWWLRRLCDRAQSPCCLPMHWSDPGVMTAQPATAIWCQVVPRLARNCY
jgi:hypothetical protein